MGGRVCVRGTGVTVGALVGLVAAGVPVVEILDAYPCLDEEDVRQAVAYAAWRASEVEVQISS
jgi:uncharacterized protein (DUF433 family)